jgi:hypothetical protein
MKKLIKAAAASALVLGLGFGAEFLWLEREPRRTPSLQPPLARLDPAKLASLRAAFNAHGDEARILVLLSPT